MNEEEKYNFAQLLLITNGGNKPLYLHNEISRLIWSQKTRKSRQCYILQTVFYLFWRLNFGEKLHFVGKQYTNRYVEYTNQFYLDAGSPVQC